MKLNKLNLDKTERFDAEYNGEAFWFEAKSNVLTPKLMQRFADIDKRPIELAESLAAIITDWSIELETEGDFPPTAENIAGVPVDFLTKIIERLGESWSGNAPKPSRSASGSAV